LGDLVWIVTRSVPRPMAALRAHSLDACTLDRELTALLSAYAERAASHFGAAACELVRPELRALLATAMWALSAGSEGQSPGQALQGLRVAARHASAYGPAIHLPPTASGRPASDTPLPRSRRLGLLLVGVLLPYLWARLGRMLTHGGDVGESQQAAELRLWRWRLMQRLEAACSVAALAAAVRHLWRGNGSPSLPLALLGLRLVYASPHEPRGPDFSFMNQELAWRTMADLAAALQALRRSLAAPSAQPAPQPLRVTPEHPPADGPAGSSGDAAPTRAALAACGFCGAAPMHAPRTAACGCAFCHYCLAAACLHQARPACPRCGESPLGFAREGKG